MRKPNVKFAIEQSLIKYKITLDAAIAPIADGLTATKSMGAGNEVYESADHSIRLKASSMALRLMGADKEQITPASVHFHQHIEEKKASYEF